MTISYLKNVIGHVRFRLVNCKHFFKILSGKGFLVLNCYWHWQKQPPRGVLKKRCSENMQQIYRTPMSKCNFNKVAFQLYWNHTTARVFSCKFSEHHFLRTPLNGCFYIKCSLTMDSRNQILAPNSQDVTVKFKQILCNIRILENIISSNTLMVKSTDNSCLFGLWETYLRFYNSFVPQEQYQFHCYFSQKIK